MCKSKGFCTEQAERKIQLRSLQEGMKDLATVQPLSFLLQCSVRKCMQASWLCYLNCPARIGRMLNLSHSIHTVFVSKADNVMKTYWGNAGLDVSIWTSLDACVTTELFLRVFVLASGSMITILQCLRACLPAEKIEEAFLGVFRGLMPPRLQGYFRFF